MHALLFSTVCGHAIIAHLAMSVALSLRVLALLFIRYISLHAREKEETMVCLHGAFGRIVRSRHTRQSPWIDKSTGWNEVARIALRVQRPCFHPRPSLAISLQSTHSHTNYVIPPFFSSFPFIFACWHRRSSQLNQSSPSISRICATAILKLASLVTFREYLFQLHRTYFTRRYCNFKTHEISHTKEYAKYSKFNKKQFSIQVLFFIFSFFFFFLTVSSEL